LNGTACDPNDDPEDDSELYDSSKDFPINDDKEEEPMDEYEAL
jgi:hypothetical protein